VLLRAYLCMSRAISTEDCREFFDDAALDLMQRGLTRIR